MYSDFKPPLPPRRGGSNKYPQSMFLSRNKKNNVYLQTPVLLYKSVHTKKFIRLGLHLGYAKR